MTKPVAPKLDSKNTREIIRGLAQNPPLLLAFAAALILGIISEIIILRTSDPITPILVPALFITMIIAALYFESKKTLAGYERNKQRDRELGNFNNENLKKIMTDIIENVISVETIPYPNLLSEVEEQLNSFNDQTTPWSRLAITVSSKRYSELLVRLYRSATKNVASTCITEYLSIWDTPDGDAILKAHSAGDAIVTRVFIFKDEKEAATAMGTLKKQAIFDPNKIGVRLFFRDNDQYRVGNPPKTLSDDFTVIDDGVIVGVTFKFDAAMSEAQWLLDRKQCNIYKRKIDWYVKNSISFSDFAAKFA